MKSFASDNYASVHPAIMAAIVAANEGHSVSYGGDSWTARLTEQIKSIFGPDAECFPVFNGTGANVVGLRSLTKSYEGILCTDISHINSDECGAVERALGVKLVDVKARAGKLSVEDLIPLTQNYGYEHQVQARVLSLTQTTERGTLYSLAELQALGKFAEEKGIRVQMDGARFANAVVAMKLSPAEIVQAAGVEVLSLGGTKNGLLMGELVVVLNPELADEMKFHRKQSMQLSSKMRFISAQFNAYLENDLWLKNAAHANAMGLLLAEKLRPLEKIKITEKVEANVVFAIAQLEVAERMRKVYPFYTWDENISEHRWMCSFDTRPEEINEFVGLIGQVQFS